MVRGKRHPDSREKRAATRLPRGAQRFASLPGSLQALTHQSRACHLLCTPPSPLSPAPARERASRPHSALQLPPAAPAHPPTLLSLSPSFIALTSRHPFPTKPPFLNPRCNAAANRADRRTPSVVCPRDPATRKS